ncbi:MAG: S8 family serine peptidase [Phycisphaerae bacterium]
MCTLLLLAMAALAAADPPAPSIDFTLTLGEERFDPLVTEPVLPANLSDVARDGADLHLVQFIGPIEDAWIDRLADRGLQIIAYVHPYTYIVWGDAAAISAQQRDAAVRWTGPFAPAYRLLPAERGYADVATPTCILAVRGAPAERAATHLAALGARSIARQPVDDQLEVIGLNISGARLDAAASIPGVYSVQAIPTDGGLRSELSDQICAGNIDENNLAFPGYLDWLGELGLSGAGVIIANVDSGIANNHPDLAGRLLPCTGTTCGGTAQSAHGTHTAGIMAADASSGVYDSYGFLRGLGMAPGAQLVEQLYSPTYQYEDGLRYLMTESWRNGASVSGNSWGASSSPHGYNFQTRQVDVGVRDADATLPGNQPLFYVLSIENGYGHTSTQGVPDEAKNIFTIGSTRARSQTGVPLTNIDDLGNTSAHGPALDGRHIPHMVAPGCYVDSTYTGGGHIALCGTSMASPHVSGAAALFIEQWRLRPDYVADPSPALIKAAFLVCTHDLAGHLDANGNTLGHPFDNKQGWGRFDAAAVLAPTVDVWYDDEPVIFDGTGEKWTQVVYADDPTQPLRIMLVWTDAPGHGLGGSTPAWNNDLDLIVSDGENVYRGNHFDADGWSTPDGTADYMNNTEGVFIGPTADGRYTITVFASNITSDGVPAYGDGTDQDFALVCYNCMPEPTFTIAVEPAVLDVCAPAEFELNVHVGQVSGFSEPVHLGVTDLPPGIAADFRTGSVLPPTDCALTVTVDAGAAIGAQQFQIVGTSGDVTHTANVNLVVYNSPPGVVTTLEPLNGAAGVDLRPTFLWAETPQANTYTLELAADAGFNDVLAWVTDLHGTSHTFPDLLDNGTEYFWRTWATNVCGDSPAATVCRFTTRNVPTILLVDDDDNGPDVRARFTGSLDTLGLGYDVWDTANSDDEPTIDDLLPYSVVIWFTGDEYGGACGPGPAGELALVDHLSRGKNLLLSSQDYYYDRGLTNLLVDYFGVISVTGEVTHLSVTGSGSAFDGLGSYGLIYPYANFSDEVIPGPGAETAFVSSVGSAAVDKDDPVYRTVFTGFSFDALPEDARAEVLAVMLEWFRPFSDCNGNGIGDHVDIYSGTSADEDGNGVPDECQPAYAVGDVNCSGEVNNFDIRPFVLVITGTPPGYPEYYDRFPACDHHLADINGDGTVNNFDIGPFVDLLTGG